MPPRAMATPSTWRRPRRCLSHSAEASATSTGEAEYSRPMLIAGVLRPPM